MSQYSELPMFSEDCYKVLQSPNDVTDDFLEKLGLIPAPFRKWLGTLQVVNLDWRVLTSSYFEHCEKTYNGVLNNSSDDLLMFGLSPDAINEILSNNKESFDECLPKQYATWHINSRLSSILLQTEDEASKMQDSNE
jgi:hypothetical protein